jgi:hypothetical protein
MEDQEEQLVRMGEEAEVLLGNDAFNTTINQLVEISFQTFVDTKGGDYDKREEAYHHYRALADIVSTLRQRVQVKDEIVSKLTADDNNQNHEEG